MRSWTKINQASAAVSNRRLVIHLLRETGPLSRRQLAQRSGLQSSTLTYITRELLASGVIRDGGKLSKAGAGKKQSLLEINPDLGWVVGIGLENSSASLVFLNSQGEVIDRDRVAIREPWDMLAQTLRARVHSWVARHGEPQGTLLGVGVGVPGIIDPFEGVVLHSTRFAFRSWPLAKVFSQTFEVPVVIDNDSKLATQAESRIGNAQNKRDFVYFLLNATEDETGYRLSSLGSSLFLNGTLHRGARFGSGEINTQIEGEPYGSIQAQAMLAISDPKGQMDASVERLADHMVGSLVAICDLVDPAAVVLGGNLSICNEMMIQYIETRLNARIARVPGRYIEVLPSRHMDHGVSLGAAITALDEALLHGSLPAAADASRPASPASTQGQVIVQA